jgi:ubiquinone biosynthesis protein
VPHARRAAVIAGITGGHLVGTAIVSAARWVRHGRRPAEVWRDRLPDLLVRLGPSFVKFGQLLSTRRDLLAEPTCRALGRLVNDVPPPSPAAVAGVLRGAYSTVPFAAFSATPIASGTIASVHRAELDDGRVVAVKVRRPGIDTVMRTDFALLTSAVRLVGALPGLRRIPLGQMVAQVGGAVTRQLDFPAERAALAELVENFGSDPAVRVPRPVDALCTPDTIVMEYLPDLVVYRPDGLDPARRREVVRQTLSSVYRMLFVDGLVHCDLHPGNLFLTPGEPPGAGLVILDAGFVVRLPERVRRLFAAFFMNMAMGRGARCADIVIESAAAIGPDCDLAGFRRGMSALIDTVHGQRAEEFRLGWFAARLFALQRRHGLYAAPEFAFPLLCLLVVEGMVNDFDAAVDFQALALPVLLETLLPSNLA